MNNIIQSSFTGGKHLSETAPLFLPAAVNSGQACLTPGSEFRCHRDTTIGAARTCYETSDLSLLIAASMHSVRSAQATIFLGRKAQTC